MILKGGLKICHGWVTGITSLGKDTEVSELQRLGNVSARSERSFFVSPAESGMEHEDGEERGAEHHKEYESG